MGGTHQPPTPCHPSIPSPEELRAAPNWGEWSVMGGIHWGGEGSPFASRGHGGGEGGRPLAAPMGPNLPHIMGAKLSCSPPCGDPGVGREARTGSHPVPGHWGVLGGTGPGWPSIPVPCNTTTVSLEVPTSRHPAWGRGLWGDRAMGWLSPHRGVARLAMPQWDPPPGITPPLHIPPHPPPPHPKTCSCRSGSCPRARGN